MILDLIRGASYPFRAVRIFFTQPQLLQYLAIPLGLNILLGIIFYSFSLRWAWNIAQFGSHWIDTTLTRFIDQLPTWLQWLDYGTNFIGVIFQIVLILFTFIISGLILVQFGVILGAPWYGKLSEQLEKIRTTRLEIVEVGIIQDIHRAILFEGKKLVLVISLTPILFLLNFIPAFGNLLSSVGGLTLSLTIVCVDFFDSPLERRRLSFRNKLQLVYRAFPASAGFSAVCLGLISIPLINLVTIPVCIASGTLFVCDRLLPHLTPRLNGQENPQ